MHKMCCIEINHLGGAPQELFDVVCEIVNQNRVLFSGLSIDDFKWCGSLGAPPSEVFRSEPFASRIKSVLSGYKLLCYHATRLLDAETIWSKGLLVNTWETYYSMLTEALMHEGASKSEIEVAINEIKEEYDEKRGATIAHKVCFFCNLKNFDLKNPEHSGFEQFCQNVGGELARWGLENCSKTYERLQTAGLPFIVKFMVPIYELPAYVLDDLAPLIFSFFTAKILYGEEVNYPFEGEINRNITPDEILDVINVSEPPLREKYPIINI